MIVPHSRLLWLTGVVLLPLAALAAVVPGLGAITVIALLVIVAVAALDAVMSLPRLGGIRLILPDVTRVTQDVENTLPITLQQEPHGGGAVRFALSIPRELGSAIEILSMRLGDAGAAEAEWPLHPIRRGKFTIEDAQCEMPSRLTLWSLRTKLTVAAEVRVYPNLRDERKRMASMFLHRGLTGSHAMRRVGKGRSFEMLREYVHGDSYEDIHWRATAKRRHPVTKVFQVERTQEVYVVIDSSRLSGRAPDADGGPQAPNLLERYISAALILQQVAQQQGDLFGLIGFSDRILRFARARGGAAHYNTCVEALYTLEPQQVTPDFEELFTFIRMRLRKRALLIFLTNLDDPVLMDSFTRHVGIISHQHVVLVNSITAPGVEPLFGPSEITSTQDVYQQLAHHMHWERLKELEKILRGQDVALHQLSNVEACSQMVDQYVRVKQRQLL